MVGHEVEAGRVYVGRRHELDRIGAACRAVRAGKGEVLVVVGPAGIGKSRLAEEGAQQATAAGLRVAWGRCWTGGGAPALWPWPTVLDQLCDPATAALLADDDPTSDAVDPERFTRFVTIGRRLTKACADRPALLVLDDLHAAGPAALMLTRYLARLRPPPAMLLLITARDGAAATELADSPPLPLQPFDLVDTGAFLAAHQSAGSAELVRAVHRVTGGNPFQLHRVVGGDRITGPAGGLRDLVGDEVSRLPAATRRLGAVAAVLGPTAPVALVAAVADVPAIRVLATVAAAPGLIETIGFDQVGFAHELVRAAFLDTLPADELLDVHARVAAVLRGWGGLAPHDRLARRAHHAAAAALRSPADAEQAVTACRAAAASMMDRYAYEEAARLLATAAGLGPPDAALLVEWACAVLAAGWLAEARELFQRAADAAATAVDPVLGAQAALGLGGVWVDEHRAPGERERVQAQQQAALDRLTATGGHAVLRARLRMRLAAEAVYTGAPLEPVHQALADCRLLGDAAALAEALSLTHHVLLRPDHAQDRLALAAELVPVAATAGDGVLVLMGMCWRAVDLFALGDPAAHRALAELRHRADTVGCRSILHVVAAMEVMLLIRSGRLTEAEQAAEACARLGAEVGDADAEAWSAAHLLTIRWLQGRGAELVELAEEVADSPLLVAAEFTFRATLAGFAAQAGQHDRARRVLDRLTMGSLAALPMSSTWLTGMVSIVEAATGLSDRALAAEAYRLLLPYAGLPAMPSLAISCLGSVERALGLAALTEGRVDAAVEHLERAVTGNERLEHRPMAVISRADLALALARRGTPADRRRAAELIAVAAAEADRLEMPARAAAWRTMAGPVDQVRMHRRHRQWELAWSGRTAVVTDMVGMHHLAELLARPGVSIPALQLAGDTAAPGIEPSRQPVLDATARHAYRARTQRLVTELAEARARDQPRRVAELEREADAIADELGRATGVGGRTREFHGPAERARTAVRKAIKRAVETVADAEPGIGAELRATVSTGYLCSYTPS